MCRDTRTPYAGFRNDRERLLALISRDLRLVAVAVLCAHASNSSSGLFSALLHWLRSQA